MSISVQNFEVSYSGLLFLRVFLLRRSNLLNFSKNVIQRVAVYVKQLDSERVESWFLVVTSHMCSDIENLVARTL